MPVTLSLKAKSSNFSLLFFCINNIYIVNAVNIIIKTTHADNVSFIIAYDFSDIAVLGTSEKRYQSLIPMGHNLNNIHFQTYYNLMNLI